ncbi:hypothetical protein GIW81_00805 [Hyphomicrobium sp. xq]|uniref:Uncharacterized protein n=1 Tax=Hyphomicrobium album TaxID=2665159 RepID=A0A6I3KGJ2_9HYPH|nr:hypothetical protein [Hyphomicrobium album]MTD92867.1 hypothetical protein [Hyphomicrobium album]
MDLNQTLDMIARHGFTASVGNGVCLVVFRHDGNPPAFVNREPDGTYTRRAVLAALGAH